MKKSAFESLHFWRLYALYCLFLVAAAWFSVGWVQADEHFRVLEPAHSIAYGYATLPWEFNRSFPLVSYLLGLLHAPLLFGTSFLGASGLTEAFLLRAFSGLVASTRVIAFHWLTAHLDLKPERRTLYTFLFALGPSVPLMSVRTSQENWSTTAFIWACVLLVKALHARQEAKIVFTWQNLARHVKTLWSGTGTQESTKSVPFWQALALGSLISLTFCFRFQAGFSAAALGLLVLACFGIRGTLPVVFGVLLGLVPMALTDLAFNGIPFWPALNYLTYALGGEEGGEVWGTDSWTFYVGNYFSNWYPPLSPLLLAPLCIGFFRSPLMFVSSIPFLAVHFTIGHKETRYLSPMLPFMYLASFIGFEWLEAHKPQWFEASGVLGRYKKVVPWLVGTSSVVAVALAFFPMSTAPRLFSELNERQNAGAFPKGFVYVADSRTNVSLFYYKHPYALPVKWDLKEFLAADFAMQFMPWTTTYAIYRIEAADLEKVERHCALEFSSHTQLARKLLTLNAHIPRKKRMDVIVSCPKLLIRE